MNEVKIIIRSHNDTARGFESARTDVKRWADESSKIYTERMTVNLQTMGEKISGATTRAGQKMGQDLGESMGTTLRERLTQNITKVTETSRAQIEQAGRGIGNAVGQSAGQSIVERIRDRLRTLRGADGGDASSSARSGGVDRVRGARGGEGGKGGDATVDVDKQSLLSRFAAWGKDAASGFQTGFADGIKNVFGGDVLSTIIKSVALGGLVTALAVPLASAVTAAMGLALGGGAIAAGVVAAFKDPRIAAAGEELKTKMGVIFAKFGEPFRGPVAEVMEKINSSLFPMLERLGGRISKIFAPLTQRLGDGLIGMLQNMLPGIADAMEGLAPVIQVLADRLPDIGRHLGDFFALIGGQGDDAAVFFNDLISLTLHLIDVIGTMIATFTSMYANIHNGIAGAIKVFRGLPDAIAGGIHEILTLIRSLNDGWDGVGDTFRNLWNGIKRWLETGKGFFGSFLNYVVGVFDKVLNAAVHSMGWIPGIGGKLRTALAQFTIFKNSVNAQLNGIHDKVVNVSINYSIRTFGKPMSQIDPYGYHGLATGGISGAASGRMAGGLTWVGERGPELADLPTGTTVHSSGDSMRLMRQGLAGAGGGMGGVLRADVDPMLENTLIGVLIRSLRLYVGDHGGVVQDVLGRRN